METVEDNRYFATLAVFASVVLHLSLLWLVLQKVVEYTPPPHFIAVEVVQLKPPPPPVPKPVPKPKPAAVSPPAAPKPVTHAAAGPVLHAMPQHRAQERSHVTRMTSQRTTAGPPVMHFGAAGAQAGLGLDLGTPAGGNGQGSIDGFDDSVKQRIQAARTYPPGLPYMWNECVVSYSVTIARNGQLVDYRLWGCGNPFLDSAARAAILMASPFPLPPDFGGSQYTVFGSLVFKNQ